MSGFYRFPARDPDMRRKLGDMLREVVSGKFAVDGTEEPRAECGRCAWFPGDGKCCLRFSNVYGANYCHSVVRSSTGACDEFAEARSE